MLASAIGQYFDATYHFGEVASDLTQPERPGKPLNISPSELNRSILAAA
jgi:hypothetical protein